MSAISLAYVAVALLLTVYALNSLIISILFISHRSESQPQAVLTHFPRVTVQLPIFNEALVIDRLIHSVVHLDWPRDRLQIQVLDDSTDETTAIARACVDRYRAEGIDIQLVRRADRSGFKAGALKEGLKQATGELIAIFDADFVPEPDWLRKTVPHFDGQSRLGMLQTRWTHLNRDYSLLTRAQAIALDGHFAVEQTARHRSGLLMNFNGTAGIWRRSCIEDAGGWQTDTICEDLDLSYRAQLGGWQCLFLPDVTAPAEIPPQLAAFKRQQFRWAKGSIQCFTKLAKSVVTSNLPLVVRWQGLVHLSAYLVHPLLLLSLLVTLPLMLVLDSSLISLGFISLLSIGPPLMYALSQHYLCPRQWFRRYAYLPALMLLGTGIALNNTRGVVEALLGISNVFQRTPKFRIEGRGGHWLDSQYTLPFSGVIIGELALTAYAIVTVVTAWSRGHLHIVPFLMLYVGGFGYVAGQGLWEARYDLARWFPRLLSRVLPSRGLAVRRQPPTIGYQSPVSHITQR